VRFSKLQHFAASLSAEWSTIASGMGRFVVDASAVLHLAGAEVEVATGHELLAPTLIRSQVLSALHEAVQRGELSANIARDQLGRIIRCVTGTVKPG
jgi:hypothetical protein